MRFLTLILLLSLTSAVWAERSEVFALRNEYGGRTVITFYTSGDKQFDQQGIKKVTAFADNKGKVVKTESISKDNTRTLMWFSGNALPLKREQYNPDKTLVQDEYAFDGTLKKRVWLNANGKKTAEEGFEDKELLWRKWYDEQQKLTSQEFFGNTRLQKKTWFNPDGTPKQTEFYNQQKQVTHQEKYLPNGNKRVEYLSADGQVNAVAEFDKNGIQLWRQQNQDADSLTVLEKLSDNGQKYKEFYSKTGTLLHTNYYDAADSLVKTEFWDSNRKKTRVVQPLADGGKKIDYLDYYQKVSTSEYYTPGDTLYLKNFYKNGKKHKAQRPAPNQGTYIDEFNSMGKVAQTKEYDANQNFIAVIDYDQNGLIKQRDLYQDDKRYRIEYYNNGVLSHSENVTPTLVAYFKDEHKDGRLDTRLYYDKNGALVKQEWFCPNGKLHKQVHLYQGLAERGTVYGPDGTLTQNLGYDSAGILKTISYLNKQGQTDSTDTLDKLGNPLNRTHWNNFWPSKRDFFDTDGKTMFTTIYGSFGKPVSRCYYTPQGDKSRFVRLDSLGQQQSVTWYKNNQVTQTDTLANGKVVGRIFKQPGKGNYRQVVFDSTATARYIEHYKSNKLVWRDSVHADTIVVRYVYGKNKQLTAKEYFCHNKPATRWLPKADSSYVIEKLVDGNLLSQNGYTVSNTLAYTKLYDNHNLHCHITYGPNSSTRVYYKNGKAQSKEFYANNTLQKLEQPGDGNPTKVSTYKNGVLQSVSSVLKNGNKVKEDYKSNYLLSKSSYKDDVLLKRVTYYPNGKKQKQEDFTQTGQLKRLTLFDETGKQQSVKNFDETPKE